MKQQILVIHGATAFSQYADFLEGLRTQAIDDPLNRIQRKRWRQRLAEDLGQDYEVYMPTMPNRENAQYLEWKIWFERYFEFLHEGVVLLGYSQGGYFLAKYLTENFCPKTIKALYLIAAPIEPADFGGEDGGDFAFNLEHIHNLEKQCPSIFIFHSKDDPVVPYSHAEKYKERLKSAEIVTFDGQGHFTHEEFPDLIRHIKALK